MYQFKGRPDGREPRAEVLDVNGTFYGTTYNGGESACFRKLGCGTVYTVTASGSETVLHSFTGGSDGAHPAAGLIDVNGTLYGATEYGGGAGCKKAGCGTVYSITTSGSEKVLHSFSGSPDGARPAAPLINVDGTLYGTTKDGGTSECHRDHRPLGCGIVYSITASASEKVLHSFTGGSDGAYPAASLLGVNGTLYGTTNDGGAYGDGTVFRVSTAGKEKVLYSFRGVPDGAHPIAPLIDVNGTLYGTTEYGGIDGCLPPEEEDCGTIYRVSTAGAETVVYKFPFGGGDGADPRAGLISVHGILYGTTYYGGVDGEQGYGTLFSVTNDGKEHKLHTFANGGYWPAAGLINVDGTLYGTTAGNDGTLYRIRARGAENTGSQFVKGASF
ncbi:MAG: choice-of-anchor tandem repeat GloVer-containing protein [Candidatus Cybelea sp.]